MSFWLAFQAMPKNSLDLYNRKRDFSKTAEPKGAPAKASRRKAGSDLRSKLRYVVQKHAASRLHFDFRLEYDGVLKSWAVPKGPCLDPSVKRLAVEVEDHPIEYGEFEGTIPRGEYGGGTVQLWDRGTWKPEDPAKVEKALAKGHLAFELDGERLHGRWNLVRTSGSRYGGGGGGNEKGRAWLLIKGHDAYASEDDPEALAEIDQSIKTGRSMVEIATGKSAVWRSNRSKAEDPVAQAKEKAKRPARRKKAAIMPGFTAPQLATLQESAPNGTGWVHEIKLDGYRVQIHVANGEAIAYTRKGLDWSDHFPEIVAAAAKLPDCILDGEVVALAAGGQSDFSALQSALERDTTSKLIYFAFDLLYADGRDYRDGTLEERKSALKSLLGGSQIGRIRYTEHLVGDGETIRQSACDMELEGIVSKRLDGRYRSGRTLSWLKTKCRLRQEFVVGGYIRREGGNPLTALVVGAYEGGKFRYKGKVGTGYNAQSSAQLLKRLARLGHKETPFAKEGAQPEKPREIDWVKPELVVEVEFTSWTGSGVLRQASFKGLREDKPASEVGVEKAKTAKAAKAPAAASKPSVSNPDKLLWPDDGVTKQQLADYYRDFAAHLLPHVAHRPISLIRAPDGIEGELFFQRHYSKGMPDGIKIAKVRAEKQPYVMIQDAEGLRGLAQFGVVEIHPWGALTKNIEKPDQLIFDLDPDEGLAFPMIKRAALGMRAHLDNFGLHSFPKLTGGKGVHVVVPLVPHLKWDEAKAFTKEIAEAFERVDPANFTATMSKSKRKGRIFIDYLRNARTATAVSAWSPRARPGAPIAVPVTWEFFSGLKSLPVYSMTRPDEAARHFDAWKNFDTCRAKLTRAMLKQAGI